MMSTSQATVARFFGKAHAGFVLTAALAAAGCASKPWMQAMPGDPVEAVTVVETDAPTLYIIVQPADSSAPPPEVIVQQTPPTTNTTNDGWVPTALPAANPFERFRTWVGDYDCVQGNTGMALRIMDVRGRVVRAIFDFMHSPSGAKGSYMVMGSFDPETRRVRFEPSSWIVQPDNYVMVPMAGEISTDDSLFAGKIDFHGCGAFKLKPTR